jgi:protein phosphatase
MLRWSGFGTSHQGLVRPTNQDAFFVDNDAQLWAVADGMGGHPGGDVASRLVIDTLAGRAVGRASRLHGSAEDVLIELHDMVESAHRTILDHTRHRLDLLGMGTTLTLLHISPQPIPTATILNEGDSRAYLFRRGTLTRLTRDHSVVEEYVRQGLLSPAQALHHPQRHVLSRALGLGSRSDADATTECLEPEDLVLLCTDGLTKMIEDDDLAAVITKFNSDQETLCRALITRALQAGGIDNVTIVIVSGQN